MEVVHERCCGLDVHKKLVVACLLTPGGATRRTQEVRTFGTMTRDLLQLADWLAAASCTHVAMESTGSYWKPVYNILEATCTVLVVNAQHMKAGPAASCAAYSRSATPSASRAPHDLNLFSRQGAEKLDTDGVVSRYIDFFEAAPRGLKARATA